MNKKRPRPIYPVRPPRYRRTRWPWALAALVILAAGLNHYYQWYPWPWLKKEPSPPAPAAATPIVPPSPGLIDFQKIKDKSDRLLVDLNLRRKKEFGLDQSVDMVVGADESIRVGRETVSLDDILSQIEILSGEEASRQELPLIETRPLQEVDLTGDSPPAPLPPPDPQPALKKEVDFYGVYVVRRGDNLWDIHFAILREYLNHRGIDVPPNADEIKSPSGRSSGVSRILKWAESMVHIFNMKTKSLDQKLDLLEPNEKVVVFNLTHLHRILGALKSGGLDQVQYDGRKLYLPDGSSNGAEASP